MAVKEFDTKQEALALLPVLKAMGAKDAITPEPRKWIVTSFELDQKELDAVLVLLDGERRTPAVVAMAVKAVRGR